MADCSSDDPKPNERSGFAAATAGNDSQNARAHYVKSMLRVVGSPFNVLVWVRSLGRSFPAFQQLCQASATFEPALWLPDSPKLAKGPAPPPPTTTTQIESKFTTATTVELKEILQPTVSAIKPVAQSPK